MQPTVHLLCTIQGAMDCYNTEGLGGVIKNQNFRFRGCFM